MNIYKENIGTILFISSLVILFLLNLPLNLSVICANENQGFAFTWGQSFLKWGELACGRGILFVSLYAAVLKIFGFNTYSIIAIHFISTVILISIGILIYLITKKLSESNFLGGLAVLLWVILISTPIGASPLVIEIRSHYNLNEENLCILFSLLAIYCLLSGGNKLSFLAGLFSVCSLMSKANGLVICIALLLWFLQLFLFSKKSFKFFVKDIIYCIFGIVVGLIFFNVLLYFLKGDLIPIWKDYFLLGSYTQGYLISLKSFLNAVLNLMTRHTTSTLNFILFFIALSLFIIGIIKSYFRSNHQSIFWSLISIWGIGNLCAILAPGEYQPYYYQLVWPSIAMVFAIGLKNIKKPLIFLAGLIVFFVFVFRVITAIPAHAHLYRDFSKVSIFNQVQSFQDPVLSYDINTSKRDGYLQLADRINLLLSDKKNTFYIFNFNKSGATGLTPLSYIYAKRYSPTTVDSSLLGVPTILGKKLSVLKRDLTKRKPDILIVSKEIYLKPWQIELMEPFLEWFGIFVQENYSFLTNFNFTHVDIEKKTEQFVVYKKIK